MTTKIKIDFLKPTDQLPVKPKPTLFILTLLVIGIVGLFFYLDLLPYYPQKTGADNLPPPSFWQQLKWLVASPEKQVTGETLDRINILLLGIGGPDHAGADLTDTVMLASLKPSTSQVALLSIPRDLAANYNGGGWRKINSVNAYAEEKLEGSGATTVTVIVSNILNQPIPYYIRLDFSGFKKLIDEFGGVTINVENSFDDYQYPIEGREEAPIETDRLKHLRFEAGWQTLNGERALEFARSRHAVGIEGSDFARARRQQKIIESFKDKVFSFGTVLNPYRLEALINAYQTNVKTNLKTWELLRLANLVKKVDTKKILTKIFDNSNEGPLVEGIFNGSYLLYPKLGWGDFSELRDITANIFAQAKSQLVAEENAKIIIENGTKMTGLAAQAAKKLRPQGLNILFTRNALQQDYSQTIIFDLTGNRKQNSAQLLRELFNTTIQSQVPTWLKEQQASTSQAKPDFLIILGQDYQK